MRVDEIIPEVDKMIPGVAEIMSGMDEIISRGGRNDITERTK